MELWSTEQAAHHWGVTRARARGILSNRRISRISGYPADAVRAVHRHQGARTDLAAPQTALSIGEAAAAIARGGDDATRLRVFFEFARGADEAGAAALPLITAEPLLIGEPRFDALLAAIAEHLAARHGLPGPLWTITVERFLHRAWWISPLPSARVQALLWTPASFRRRGIYLDRHDLAHDGVTPMMPEPLFDLTDIRRALSALAAKLERRRVVGQVHVYGGAAMILAYDPARTATRDIDAQFSPDGPMIAAIREVARENRWPTTWLNNQAASYVARHPGEGDRVFDHPYLQVNVTPPEHLLAMKVLAGRAARDAGDLDTLLRHLEITTAEQVWAIVDRFFPGTSIPQRGRGLVEDLLNQRRTER
ncbi:hypothetical protein [Mycobacterium attenuatum]|uniref:hypothetical protein n=1 Tax=Mycobacterium attenuatum TaxID=2341086 RepID=UPI000F0342D1|nr:hypothetical protein [Mycobacterium attenuatum]VBA62427.1 hypothetical protein LAUMK41_05818 [Mycobacterium attenuatum]